MSDDKPGCQCSECKAGLHTTADQRDEGERLRDRVCALESAAKSAENGFLQFDLANLSTVNDRLRAALATEQAATAEARELLEESRIAIRAALDSSSNSDYACRCGACNRGREAVRRICAYQERAALPQPTGAGEPSEGAKPWPDPTPEMLSSVLFEAIWQTIKTWDINVPGVYAGYMGATGNHARAILDGLHLPPAPPSTDGGR